MDETVWTGAYMREGTTLRVMAADRLYSEFCDFNSVSPKYFRYTLVLRIVIIS
jgi:hypothetical protein